MEVSLFASSVRPKLYESFFKSLEGTSVECEVVFAGYLSIEQWAEGLKNLDLNKIVKNRYIPTKNIKPAQCYEIARRACIGETVVWVADDAEFPDDVIGKAYKYWKNRENDKLILSIQTRETGYNLPEGAFFNMNHHRFFGYKEQTPLMAPLGMMSREFLNELGGIDRRYVCGQYENDIVMRAYKAGGSVEIFGDEKCFIDIDHLGKSFLIGESKTQRDFLKRPFAVGYGHDRSVLEKSWIKNGEITLDRTDQFEPFEEKDILLKSQGPRGIWE